MAKLAGLFALDAFAGGFIVQSIVAYWFYLRYKTDLNALGGIFFGTNLLAALSFLAAPAIARRFGLLNTMVFTHLPSNILLLLVPVMPNLELAVDAARTELTLDSSMYPPANRIRWQSSMWRVNNFGRNPLRRSQQRRSARAALHRGNASGTVPGFTVLLVGGLKIIYHLWIFVVFRKVNRRRRQTDRLCVIAA